MSIRGASVQNDTLLRSDHRQSLLFMSLKRNPSSFASSLGPGDSSDLISRITCSQSTGSHFVVEGTRGTEAGVVSRVRASRVGEGVDEAWLRASRETGQVLSRGQAGEDGEDGDLGLHFGC